MQTSALRYDKKKGPWGVLLAIGKMASRDNPVALLWVFNIFLGLWCCRGLGTPASIPYNHLSYAGSDFLAVGCAYFFRQPSER
jgi:hypothetical protein